MAIVRHLGIIPDGNRRWGVKNKLDLGLTYIKSYRVLNKIILELFNTSPELNEISIFFLSHDNLINRKKHELDVLFKLARRIITGEILKYQMNGFFINWVGLKDAQRLGFDKELFDKINKSLTNPAWGIRKGVINIILGYSPERDIIENYDHEERSLLNLEIKTPLDCIIRTGGKKRLSGFLPFHTKYSSIYFIDKYMPDLTLEDVLEILSKEKHDDQNFGK